VAPFRHARGPVGGNLLNVNLLLLARTTLKPLSQHRDHQP
jgi:hypothetical protein